MKKVLIGAAFAVTLTSGAAFAADLPVAGPVYKAPVAAEFSWSGAYIGGNVGGIWGRSNYEPSALLISGAGAAGCGAACDGIGLTPDRANSLIGGFQTGVRWQRGALVLGIEQDFRWTRLDHAITLGAALPGAGGPFVAGDTFSSRLNWRSDTRGMLGLAWGRFMVYGAGGLATGDMDVTASYVARGGAGSPARTFSEEDKFHVGWTGGGGVEYAMTDNVSLGVEYRYTDLRGRNYNLGAVTTAAGGSYAVSSNVSLQSSEIIGRLNIKTSVLTSMFGF